LSKTASQSGWFDIQNMTVEEKNGTQGLILRGRGNVFLRARWVKNALISFSPHVFFVTFVVEENVFAYP
jgi:hypothetical protein